MEDYINPNILSIIAVTISVLSFSATMYNHWRNQARLLFYVFKKEITNQSDNKKYNMLHLRIANVGFQSIIIEKFIGFKENGGTYESGIGDNPAAVYGILKQVFPMFLEPGKTLSCNPIGLDQIEINEDKKNNFTHFALIDSKQKQHFIGIDEIRRELGIGKTDKKAICHKKIINYLLRKAIYCLHRLK